MKEIYTQSEVRELLVTEIRKAIEHRATWMYFLLKEAQERGLEWDDFAREAIKKTGAIHGQLKREKLEDPSSLEDFSQNFAGPTSRGVFQMEVVKQDEEGYHLDFHYCPLVNAWQKLGATPEEIDKLCDIAMDGDRGIAEQFPEFEFSLGKTIAKGDKVCEIRFNTKSK
jgi:hypothetical protein